MEAAPTGSEAVHEVDNPAFSPTPVQRLPGSSHSSLSYEGRTAARSRGASRSVQSSSGVIHPRDPTKIYWDGYILLLVWYSVTYELYHTTMGDRLEARMSFSAWFVDISYWIDIALNFRTGYDEDGRGYRYVMDKRKSATRYLKGWFAVDFVSTFPYALFESTSGHPVSLLRLLRVTRLGRILRGGGNAVDLFNAAVAKFGIRAAYLDIARFVMGILLAIHCLSCLFHLVGVLELIGEISPGNMAVMWSDKEATWLHQYNLVDSSTDDNVADGRPPKVGEDTTLPNANVDVVVPMWTKYLYSTYWAITTVTTIGYGDITPVTNAELMFVSIGELLGMFTFVYTTNSVSALLRGLDAKRTAFQEHLDRIQEYMEARSIPSELQKRVVKYLTFINSPKCLTEMKEDELLAPLTGTLREELRMASYVPWLTRNPKIRDLLEVTGGVFTESDSSVLGGYVRNSELEGFVHKLSLQLHSVSAAPYDLIINSADGDSCSMTVYFLLTGKIHLYGNDHGSEGDVEDGSQVICTIDQDDKRSLFGSYELFEGTPPPEWCIEAAEYCDLAYIPREAFQATVVEEEEEHNRFHLQHAFPWTKSRGLDMSPVPPPPEPEPEPEPEPVLKPPESVRLHAERTGRGASRAEKASDVDTGSSSFQSENRIARQRHSHTLAERSDSDDLDAAPCDEPNSTVNTPPSNLTTTVHNANAVADTVRQPPVGSGNSTPAPRRRGSITDRRGSVSTGRRMARRRSITSTVHGMGQAVGPLLGSIASGAESVAAAGLDLGGFGGNTLSSNGDGKSGSHGAASPPLATVNSGDSEWTTASTGGAAEPYLSTSAQGVSSPKGLPLELEGRPDASISEPNDKKQRQRQQRQQWESAVAAKLQDQATAISAMQSQIGALSEMMRDANSKMDSLLQLQRRSVSALSVAAPAPLEQSRASAPAAMSEPVHAFDAAEADTVIVEGEEGEEGEEQDSAAMLDDRSRTTEQNETDL